MKKEIKLLIDEEDYLALEEVLVQERKSPRLNTIWKQINSEFNKKEDYIL